MIFLIPGHAYPGIKLGNSYYALEATGIGGEGLGSIMTSDQAFQAGMKEANDFFTAIQKGMPGYNLLDLDELNNEGYKEMELKDDPFLRQKVDQLTQAFQSNYRPNQQQAQDQNEDQGDGGGDVNINTPDNNRPSNSATMASHSGNINFQYPANWAKKNHPVAQLPILITMFASPGLKHGAVEIYQIPGATDASQAMAYIQQSLQRVGVQIQYQPNGDQNGLIRYNGLSSANGVIVRWMSFLRVVNGGVEGVVVGAGPNASFGTLQQEIVNTVN